jgi:hypothetical protein
MTLELGTTPSTTTHGNAHAYQKSPDRGSVPVNFKGPVLVACQREHPFYILLTAANQFPGYREDLPNSVL